MVQILVHEQYGEKPHNLAVRDLPVPSLGLGACSRDSWNSEGMENAGLWADFEGFRDIASPTFPKGPCTQ